MAGPQATWSLGQGVDFTDAFVFPECCTTHEGTCTFQVSGSSVTGQESNGAGLTNLNGGSIAGGPLMLPTPKTAGQTIAYTLVLYAHCSVLSLSFKFAPIYSSPTATAVYRVTAR